jgi:hypothetical protein
MSQPELESFEPVPKLLGRDGPRYSIAELHCLAVEFGIIDIVKAALAADGRIALNKTLYIEPLLEHCAQHPELTAAERIRIFRKHTHIRPTRIITSVKGEDSNTEFTYDVVYPPELAAVLQKHGLSIDKTARVAMYKNVPPYNPFCYYTLQDLCYLDKAAVVCTPGPRGIVQLPLVCVVCLDEDLETFVPESDL